MARFVEAPRIGVSSCLLGQRVRFDAGHKLDAFITGTLGRWCEFVAVCPEVEAGFGVPRPTLHLAVDAAAPRLLVARTGEDVTERMAAWCRMRVEELAGLDLDGYILKKNSPSCGMTRVKVHEGKGRPRAAGRGLFAAALMARLPLLPVEDEGRLQDVWLRENFIERIFAHRRWRAFLAEAPTAARLVEFHGRHKMTLLAHGRSHYQALGRLVAEAGPHLSDVMRAYGEGFMHALAALATRGRQADVLHHLAGHFKRSLGAGDRAELASCIDDYRCSRVPLVVPLTLLRHHLRQHPDSWVAGQYFLDPYPVELLLRNHG